MLEVDRLHILGRDFHKMLLAFLGILVGEVLVCLPFRNSGCIAFN